MTGLSRQANALSERERNLGMAMASSEWQSREDLRYYITPEPKPTDCAISFLFSHNMNDTHLQQKNQPNDHTQQYQTHRPPHT